MLGRLGMSEDECLESFRNYGDAIFHHPNRLYSASGGLCGPKYSAEKLAMATRSVIRTFDPSPEDMKWKRDLFASPASKCKTYEPRAL